MVDQISSGHRHTADADRGEEAGAEKLSKGQTNKTGGERGAQLRPGNYKLRKEAVQRTEERTPRTSVSISLPPLAQTELQAALQLYRAGRFLIQARPTAFHSLKTAWDC